MCNGIYRKKICTNPKNQCNSQKTHSRKGPARATLALVLDRCDGSLGSPVDILGQLHIIIRLNEGGSCVFAVALVTPSVVSTESVHGCDELMVELQRKEGGEINLLAPGHHFCIETDILVFSQVISQYIYKPNNTGLYHTLHSPYLHICSFRVCKYGAP